MKLSKLEAKFLRRAVESRLSLVCEAQLPGSEIERQTLTVRKL